MPDDTRDELEKTELRIGLPKDESYPLIEIVVGSQQGKKFSIQPGTYRIGRAPDNQVQLDDSSVSRQHALLTYENGAAVLEDSGSKNGTLIKGVRMTESASLQHGDLIKIGIFLLRYLTSPVADTPSIEEIEQASQESQALMAMPAGGQVLAAVDDPQNKRHHFRWGFLIGGMGVVAVLLIGFFVWVKTMKPPPEPHPTSTGEAIEGQTQPSVVGEDVPVFVEWTTTPLPGKVYFAGTMIGVSPLRINRLLRTGQTYESRVVFELEEIGKNLEFDRPFTVNKNDNLIPITVEAPVGVFKILSLPRDVVGYLEGTFAGDPNNSHPVRLTGVAYNKPIYLPYGNYVLELKARKQVGTSEAFIDTVVYQRTFAINAESHEWNVDAKDEDLGRFPVSLKSVPDKANVFLDGEAKGETPLESFFPVGIHELKVVKEGYFDYIESVNVQLNTPYVAEITLKTSVAGQFINESRAQYSRGAYAEAKGSLAEALKKEPTPRELAEVHYLLGRLGLVTNEVKEAEAHFAKAKEHPDFEQQAAIGLAEVALGGGDKDKALQLITGVLINTEDPALKQSAGEVFSKISPLKSVIYASTDPSNADILVNGTNLGRKTPVILHDLGPGTYRLVFQLPGYHPFQTRVNLAVSEFKPIVIKLDPETTP